MRVFRLLPLLLLPLFAACESDPLASAARNVEVTASLGAADTRAIDVRVRNRGSRTVYVAACGERIVPTVQRRDMWHVDHASAFGVLCLGIYSSRPVAVEPGRTVYEQAQVPGPGEYRVAILISDEEYAEQQRVVFSKGLVVP
jgi:hypothetical protein